MQREDKDINFILKWLKGCLVRIQFIKCWYRQQAMLALFVMSYSRGVKLVRGRGPDQDQSEDFFFRKA